MKFRCAVVLLSLLVGCAKHPPADAIETSLDDFSLPADSLRRHLDGTSEWGAVQGGVSARLRQTNAGLVLVIRNDGPEKFVIDPYFCDGYNVEVEVYGEHKEALSQNNGPTFVTRLPSPLVTLEPGQEYVSGPIADFMSKVELPARAQQVVAMWYRNILGTRLRGPVITGPLTVKSLESGQK